MSERFGTLHGARMNAISNLGTEVTIDRERAMPAPVLRTLAICDLVDSTAFVERLGDVRSAEILRRHDRLARDLIVRHGGREIDKTDGFLILFDRPIHAVAFALDYQRELRALGAKETVPLAARIGIHVGDVVSWENTPADVARGAKPIEIEGLVKPTAARIMSIARPGQILLSGMASALAQRAGAELGTGVQVRWRAHGNYRFKGVPEAVYVCEVGETGIAPFKAPTWAGKAHREIPWWRRPGMLAVEAAIAIAAVAVPAYLSLRSPPAIAFAARDWVVVGDLANLTGEVRFDAALQSAFRIGLEQSHYVNVLADLKARDTLKLMQRDPEKTPIDRKTGSEIAIRDGVRALILPSVAEIGGRVRVTAEVVDPRTQTTVYSESADGVGEDSVLPSLDKVNAQLRVRLGETLAMVTRESQPLERVATKSLDALRTYSLGAKAYDRGDMKDAIAFFDQAIKLDPDFARARLWLSISYYNVEQFDEAAKAISQILKQPNRLMPRDVLFAEAWQTTMSGSQRLAIEKWKKMAQLYPDFFIASRLAAFFGWKYGNSFASDVIGFAQASISPQGQQTSIGERLLGILYLGDERYGEAEHHFTAINQTMGGGVMGDHARVFAAQRNFAKADTLLAASPPDVNPVLDFDRWRSSFTIALDRGDMTLAWSEMAEAETHFTESSSQFAWLHLNHFGLSALLGKERSSGIEAIVLNKAYGPDSARTAGIEYAHRQFAVLFRAYLAAHEGNVKTAEALLATGGPEPDRGDYPMLDRMRVIARAELTRAQGRPADAIALLKPELNGSELYLTHAALMQAYSANRDWQDARGEAQWLAAHRGRAYAEFSPQELLLPYNVMLSDLALLDQAEYSLKLADVPATRTALERFRAVWPHASERAVLAARVTTLQTALHESGLAR